MATNDNPDPIDVAVGARIRIRRQALHVSQTVLADALNLTFQQIQKYERGTNRISTSMLVRTAAKLETTVGALVGEENQPPIETQTLVHLAKPGAARLLDNYAAMSPEARRALVDLTDQLKLKSRQE